MFHPGISEVIGFVSEVPKHFAAIFSKAPKKLFFFFSLFLFFKRQTRSLINWQNQTKMLAFTDCKRKLPLWVKPGWVLPLCLQRCWFSLATFPAGTSLRTCQAQLLLLQPQPQLQILQLVLVSIWIIYFSRYMGGKKKKKAVQDLFSKRTHTLFCLCLNSDRYINKRYLNAPLYIATMILFFCLIVPPVFKARDWAVSGIWCWVSDCHRE